MSHDLGTATDQPARAFEVLMRVRFHEVDALGHVNNAAYLNYLEQAAIDHATHLGLDLERLRVLGGVFVARRHDVKFLQPAYAGDVLRIVTWLGAAHGARVERHYRIYRELEPPRMMPTRGTNVVATGTAPESALAVEAMTEWVFAGEQGRARRIPREIVEAFERGTRFEIGEAQETEG